MALRDAISPRRLFAWTGDEQPSLVWFGVVLAALYWFLESAIHGVVFKEGALGSQFLTLDPHEVWKRLMVASLLIAFSLYAQRGLDHRKRIEKSLRSAHAELEQIFETASVAMRLIDRSHRVAEIVVNLLSFARPHQREYQVTDLTQVLRDTLTLTAAQLRKEGIRVEIEMPDDLPRVSCIPQQLQQVFLNILNNSRYALDRRNGAATDHPQITITADCQTSDETPFLRLSFRDNGQGIPRQVLDKVTRPFFTTKPRGKGTGLGLSISHGIVTEQGGRLVVESDEGEFTRVSVLLPAFRESQAEIRNSGPTRPHAEMGEPS